jgi:beta-fructofuranosidase
MKKLTLLLAGISLCFIHNTTLANSKTPDIQERLYPRFGSSFVGDPIPFVDNNEMQIFYLNDARFGSEAFHPWYRTSTKNFISYIDHGEAIPFVEDLKSQELALGTGSVIKVGDTYHAFYTGHNKHLFPYEAILHATSKDMKNWIKYPDQTFFAPNEYEKNDFRDPHVIYMKDYDEYWMLVTARKKGKGVIAKFSSNDLKHWKDDGVFFKNDTKATDTNLECPTLIKYGKYWYLSFSDQWPDRVTQYRISKNPTGPFKKPDTPAIDGRGFYAGKLAEMNGKLYVSGWTPTKQLFKDSGDFSWAGNLVIHELKQNTDGELMTIPPETVIDSFTKKNEISVTNTTSVSGNAYKFEKGEYQITTFGKINGITKIEGIITTNGWNNKQFGITFNVINDRGRLNLVFDKNKDKIYFYNVALDLTKDFKPQIELDHEITDNTKFTIIIDDSVLVMYVDDEIALSTRMYRLQGRHWGIFSKDTNAEFKKLELSTK